MILDDSSSKALKKYLSLQLEQICDADPEVLADYVIALLKYDKPSNDLKQLCISQLDDFLKEETEPFVRKLFNVLSSREYLGEKATSTTINQPQQSESSSNVTNSDPTEVENKPTKVQVQYTDKNDNQHSSKAGVRKREESEASEEDDDRNYKHKEREGDNREEHRRYTEKQGSFSNREDDGESNNKRFRGEGIPTGPAAGSQYNSNFTDDRNFKRRRDESDDEFRSSKIPRNNLLGSGQNMGGTSNNYVAGNGIGTGARRPEFDRDNRLNNRSFVPMSPNPSAQSMNAGRWGNEWGTNGMNVPVVDRFDDRRMRGGRINDRGGRGGPMIRGGFSDMRPGRRQRCRDYDEKGYCMRGDLCPFDHGVDRIVVDDVPLNRPPFDIIPPIGSAPLTGAVAMMGPSRPPFFMGTHGVRNQFDIETFPPQPSPRAITPIADAYDPERAALSRPEEMNPPAIADKKDNEIQQITDNTSTNSAISLSPTSSVPHFLDSTAPPLTRGVAFRGRVRGRAGRGIFARTGGGNNTGQSIKNSTLAVENIPTEFCAIEKVNDFFKKFGTITNINVDLPYHRAIIQFSSNQEASKAYNSPEPIFDNRFVKVYWHKAEKDEQQNAVPLASKQPIGPSAKMDSVPLSPSTEVPIPSLADKQKEAEEKLKKQKENLKAMLEIQKQKEQLIQRQIDEQKKLMEFAKKKTVDAKSREEVLKSLSKVSEEIKKDASVSVLKPILSGVAPILSGGALSKTIMEERERERLDRELDALSKLNESGGVSESVTGDLSLVEITSKLEEGKAEGVPVVSSDNPNESPYKASRGRGIFPLRGRVRSVWPRARGGSVARSYKLDNRPTKLLVKDIPTGSLDTLRSYFEQFGEVESSNFTEETQSVIVQYKNRHEAEQAFFKGRNIPNVGVVSISWYTDSSPPSGSGTNQDQEPTKLQTTTSEIKSDNAGDFDEEEDDDRDRSWKR